MLSNHAVVAALKAVAEPTRHRIVMLLAGGELNVKDLTRILGQSQPRISRHLKLLAEAGVIERTRDGAWVYFQLVAGGPVGVLVEGIIAASDPRDPQLQRDRTRAETVKKEREAEAQAYFEQHAADWDKIRSLHVPEARVEDAVRRALGDGPFHTFVDAGTGTGRILELMADRYERGIGVDINHTMLAYARTKLAAAGIRHAQVRHGDLYALALPDGCADGVAIHQVLHFLSEPAQAVREAARILEPGGRLVIVDFAPHDLEFLRESHAHDRLGFARSQVEQWLTDGGLELRGVEQLAKQQSETGTTLEVVIWAAVRPGQSPHRRARQFNVETIG